MTTEDVKTEVARLVAQILGYEPDEYAFDDSFEFLGADSLSMVELTEAVEELLDLSLSELEILDLKTPAELVDFITAAQSRSEDSPKPNRFPQRIFDAAGLGSSLRLLPADEVVGWDELLHDAGRYVTALGPYTRNGFGRGSKIALIGASGREVVTAIEATWIAGAAIAVMPIPFRFSTVEEFAETIATRVQLADIELVLVDELAASLLNDADLGAPILPLSELAVQAANVEPLRSPAVVYDDDSAILQFTSGSTTAPRAVNVTYGVLEENLNAVADRLGIHSRMVGVSWLPLYHDMGLVGVFASAMTRGGNLVLAGPQDYIADPSQWMQWVDRYRAELTVGPNSAYARAARFLDRTEDQLDLSTLKIALNGAEPISPDGTRAWLRAGERHGLDPSCVFPAFGMAEVGIAVSFAPIGRGLITEHVDADLLETDLIAVPVSADHNGSTRELVLLGQPVSCLEVQIQDPTTGEALSERRIGEMCLRGPSVMPGYYKLPEENEKAFRDGWFRTGDYAYLTETGEIVCCGRIKDMIIVAGRNIYPQDLEVAAETVSEVRAGNSVAFGVPDDKDGERIVMVAESSQPDSGDLRRAVKQAVSKACDVAPRKVVIVPPGTLPKTSSGKLQRSSARDAYLAGHYTN